MIWMNDVIATLRSQSFIRISIGFPTGKEEKRIGVEPVSFLFPTAVRLEERNVEPISVLFPT